MTPDELGKPATRGDVAKVKEAVDELSELIKGKGRHDGLLTQFRVLQTQVKFFGLVLAAVAIEALRSVVSSFSRGGGN